jgi:quinoprotein glucose dehydrogenase
VPAVVLTTKSGQLFVLDRLTGRPLFAVAERAAPASDVPGERAAPTQPFSIGLPQLASGRIGETDLFGVTPQDRAACRADFRRLRHDGRFTPPSLRGAIVAPGNIGGAHWGGLSFDPARQIAVIPVNHVASVVTLTRAEDFVADPAPAGAGDRTGLQTTRMQGTPYVMQRRRFAAPSGMPCTRPPFGTLQAISLRSGRRLWRVPLGSTAGIPGSGSLNLGGPITTASGLVFIAATPDAQFRAFDTATGAGLWTARLPAGARSTPMTYLGADARQYVVIAAGGFGRSGLYDAFVAFALPR